jgi:hypothetical protein
MRATTTRTIVSAIKAVLLTALCAGSVLSSDPCALAATPGEVDLMAITVTPGRLSPGQHPVIETQVGQSPGGSASSIVVNIIAIVTRPDNQTRSWNWEKIMLPKGSLRTITVPKEFNTSAAGTYRAEILIYSNDMKKRLARRTQTFEVAERRTSEDVGTAVPDKKRSTVGVGLYGNTLNPAAGGMVLCWPSNYVGIEGIYASGEFTSYEGRLLVRTDRSQGYNFYGGIGYIHVGVEKEVIGVVTRFSDSGVSGAVGVEANIGNKVRLYVEASAASIALDQIVTSGPQTVKATVKYAPVTVGIGLVMLLF